ncbi:Mitochondrial matrix iron chaperone [Coemansia sp. RSA 1821]|nr:Mitochondrial matrix iron chaperone [Coemansia sp. RSA 1821]
MLDLEYRWQQPDPVPTTHLAITEHEYNKLADATMDDLVTYLEDLGDSMEIDDFDVEYSQGVLTLSLGSVGTYVINKQPPNRQIWISSPISGPERFDYQTDRDAWICRKTSDTLGELLQRELQKALPLGNLNIPIN